MKRNLLKVIGISFFIFVILSWIIPVGTYTSGKLSTTGIDPVGLGDLFNKPISAIVTFALYGVVFAVIGGFYGVVEKTGALEKIVDKMSRKFDGKENKFLVLTIVLFILLSSLTGLIIPLFVLVPLFAYVLFKLNFDKITIMASTVGSLLLGSVASTYGFNISGYTKNLLSLDMNFQIIPKVIILVLVVVLFSLWTIRNSKKDTKKATIKEAKKTEEKKEVKKTEKSVSKKVTPKKTSTKKTVRKTTRKGNTKALAVIPDVLKVGKRDHIKGTAFVIIFIVMLLVAFIGMYNWYYSFNIDVFTKAHEAVMGVKIKDFAIFESLLSGISQLGYWSNIEFAALLVVTSMIIAFVYKLSLNDYIESFIEGVKKWLPTAIYSTLASVILVILYQSLQGGSGTLVNTICAKVFDLVDGFNPIVTGVASFIGSFFFNDLYYLLATLSSFVSGYKGTDLSVAGLVIQSVYGIAMMIFPTSIVLISGLSIFDVSYKDWIKYIWKFALITLLLILVVCSIVVLL